MNTELVKMFLCVVHQLLIEQILIVLQRVLWFLWQLTLWLWLGCCCYCCYAACRNDRSRVHPFCCRLPYCFPQFLFFVHHYLLQHIPRAMPDSIPIHKNKEKRIINYWFFKLIYRIKCSLKCNIWQIEPLFKKSWNCNFY